MRVSLIDYISNFDSSSAKGIHENEVPLFIWDEKLLSDKDYFEKFVLRLMDMCISNPAMPHESNPMENYQIKDGKVSFDKIIDVTRPHNVVGAAFEKGHDLLQTPINGLINENRKQPIKYSIVRTDDRAIKEKVDKAARIIAENAKAAAVQTVAQQFNLEPAQLIGDGPENTIEDAKNILEQPSDKEMEIRDRVSNVIETTRTKENIDAAIEDRFVVNMEVGKVSVKNNEVEFERFPITNFSYIGGDGETLEYAMAASHWSFVSFSQVVIEDSMNMSPFKREKDFYEYVQDMMTTNIIANSSATNSDIYNLDIDTYFNFGTSVYDTKILKQDIEFRLVRQLCFKVYYKDKPITEAMFEEYSKYGSSWEQFDYIDFIYTEKESGICVYKPIVETFEARRYGSKRILYIRKKNDMARELSKFQYSPFSYVMRRTSSPSLVTVAAPLNEMYQIAMFKIREAGVRSGGKALKAYANYLPQNYSSVNEQKYAANVMGIMEMQLGAEGSKSVPNDNMTTVDLDETQTIMRWIQIAISSRSLLENTLGLSPERLANSGSDTATQAGLSYRSSFILTAHHFYNHDMFVVDIIKAIVNTGRKVWTSTKYMTRLATSQIKLLKEIAEDGLVSYGIYVNDSSKDAEMINSIKSMTAKWMDRISDMDSMEAALAISVSDNPEDALKKFQLIKDNYNKAVQESNAAQAQRAEQAQQQAMEINKQSKIDVPLEKIRSDERIAAAKLDSANMKHKDTQLFKEDSADIARQNQLQDKQIEVITNNGDIPAAPKQ